MPGSGTRGKIKILNSIAGLIKASADNPFSSEMESDLHFIAAWVLHEKNEELEDIVAAEHLDLEILGN